MEENMFRNYAAALTSPTAWIGILVYAGLILFWFKQKKLATISLTLGLGVFTVFSFDPVTEFLLNDFENRYPAFDISKLQTQKPRFIVVLAGGYVPNPGIHPPTTELTPHTLNRVVEGIRIHRMLEGSSLVFTGRGWASRTEAQAMKDYAMSLGVKSEKIIIETSSRNTFEHTQFLKPIIGSESFVLVTSAIHMPRAMGLFTKAGYRPIPAPTGHLLVGPYSYLNMKVPFPRGENLAAIDWWFNEFFAIRLAEFRGRM